jgi:uncharacterized protein YqgC (DUF456 family)
VNPRLIIPYKSSVPYFRIFSKSTATIGQMGEFLWLATAALLMVPGFVGLFIPIFPGIPFMFLVALTYGAITSFTQLTGSEIGILAIIAVVSIAVDYLGGVLGAKYSGASAKALAGGFLGMLVGLFLIPPFGGLLGLFFGVLIVEIRIKNHHQALRAATGSLIGSLAGIVINLLLAIVFLTLFLVFAWPR